MKLVKIAEFAGGPNWISTEDGLRVFDAIYPSIKSGEGVELSFAGKQFVTTAFLNAVIGKLYNGDFSDDVLLRSLKYVDADESDLEKINRVIARAKAYFSAPDIHDAVLKGESCV